MKTLQIHQEMGVRLSELLEARDERYRHLDKFPELKNVKIVDEERNGDLLSQTRHIHLTESLPPALSVLIPGGTLILIEKSVFNSADNTHTFEIIPGPGIDHLFRINGISRYSEAGETTSVRDYDIKVESTVFLAGGLIENTIAEIYKNNLERDRKSILDFIEMKRRGE
jgi:hypothetical protein